MAPIQDRLYARLERQEVNPTSKPHQKGAALENLPIHGNNGYPVLERVGLVSK
jgi:hypothetical protein